MARGIPAEVEEIADEARVGKLFDSGGVEEDGEVGEFLEWTVLVGVVGIINQFDLLDVFVFGFVEVSVGGVDDDS